MASRQQTLWDWASESAQHDLEEIRPRVRGKLFLGELPNAPARDMFARIRAARQLHVELEEILGKINLYMTNNRRRMLTARKKKEPTGANAGEIFHEVRLHHMFLTGGEAIVQDLAGFIQGNEGARERIRDFIQHNKEAVSHGVDAEQLKSLGQFHDLEWLMRQASSLLGHDEALEGIQITWGRKGKGKRSIRLGSYDFEQRLVRIHPVLDQRWVAGYFIEYIVYHELLHALYPPIEDESGRRCVHTEEFKFMEERYPFYKEALEWEARHIRRLLQS